MEPEKVSEALTEYTIFDNPFMRAVFKDDEDVTQLVLQIILGKDDLKVQEINTEKRLFNSQGKEGIVDVLATDEEGKIYNIEIQNDSSFAQPRRARFYNDLIDTNFLGEGASVDDLPENYVIFITRHDYFGDKEPKYFFQMTNRNDHSHVLEYGVNVVYVNGEYRGNDALGLLMEDFSCKNPNNMHYNKISKKVAKIKCMKEEDAVGMFGPVMDGMLEEQAEKTAIEIAKNMIKRQKYSEEEIAENTNLPLDKVKELIEEMKE